MDDKLPQEGERVGKLTFDDPKGLFPDCPIKKWLGPIGHLSGIFAYFVSFRGPPGKMGGLCITTRGTNHKDSMFDGFKVAFPVFSHEKAPKPTLVMSLVFLINLSLSELARRRQINYVPL